MRTRFNHVGLRFSLVKIGPNNVGNAFSKMRIRITKMGIRITKMRIRFTKMRIGFIKMRIGFTKMRIGFLKVRVRFNKVRIGFNKVRIIFNKVNQSIFIQLKVQLFQHFDNGCKFDLSNKIKCSRK